MDLLYKVITTETCEKTHKKKINEVKKDETIEIENIRTLYEIVNGGLVWNSTIIYRNKTMNKIEITIKGTVGSGKTTIGQLIMKALKAEGLDNIVVNDQEELPSMAYYPARTKSLREKHTELTINMVQAKRDKVE
jgi:ABC-type glutathione transport system ATPase component